MPKRGRTEIRGRGVQADATGYSPIDTAVDTNGDTNGGGTVASRKQIQAAKRNVKKAQTAAKSKRTIAHLSETTRRDLGKQAARGRSRGGRPGRTLEDRNRQQLYELARERGIRGRSKMGKWDLIEALRRGR